MENWSLIESDRRPVFMCYQASPQHARVAVLGASGYTGAEVVRLAALHPYINITAMTADRQAGKVGVQ